MLLSGGVAIGYYGRFWSFFYDEWGTILYRRSGGLSAFLAPHNGHLQATVIAVYRLLFATFGIRSYHPYQAALILAELALVALVYIYARPRIGPWPSLAVALPLVVLADAWQVIYWAINLGFVLPLIALVALLTWRQVAVTAAAIALALASSGLGVAVAAGALVLVLRAPDRRRQLLAWSAPVLLYLIWWFAYRPTALPPAALRRIPGASTSGDVGLIRFPASNFGRAPGYVLHLAKASANAFIGAQPGGWWMLVAVTFVVVGAVIARRGLSNPMLTVIVTALVFWVEVAVTRAQYGSPEAFGASRYLYPGAVLIGLALIEAFNGVRLPPLVVLVCLVAASVVLVSNVRNMRHFSGEVRVAFGTQNALLRRAQCDPRLPPGMLLDNAQAPGLTVRPYLAAVRALGSPPGQSCGPR